MREKATSTAPWSRVSAISFCSLSGSRDRHHPPDVRRMSRRTRRFGPDALRNVFQAYPTRIPDAERNATVVPVAGPSRRVFDLSRP